MVVDDILKNNLETQSAVKATYGPILDFFWFLLQIWEFLSVLLHQFWIILSPQSVNSSFTFFRFTNGTLLLVLYYNPSFHFVIWIATSYQETIFPIGSSWAYIKEGTRLAIERYLENCYFFLLWFLRHGDDRLLRINGCKQNTYTTHTIVENWFSLQVWLRIWEIKQNRLEILGDEDRAFFFEEVAQLV